MRKAWRTVVVGAGPVGLIAALAAARRGHTTVVAKHWPPKAHRSRIDVVPAPFLTLLLELGVSPRQIGITHLYDTQLTAWESALPTVRRRPACAHIERARLENALAEAIERDARIDIRTDDWQVLQGELVMDATGRAAASAQRRIAPPCPWIAETFHGEIPISRALEAFRIAALPTGYAYRVGHAGKLTVGVIRWRASGRTEPAEEEIRAHGAGWLLQGVAPLSSMKRGRGGACALQWSEPSPGVVCIGDANMARDSLASQGIANGAADALRLASGELSRASWSVRTHEQRQRHVAALRATLEESRFSSHSLWHEYRCFLSGYSPPLPSGDAADSDTAVEGVAIA
jgi:2-polyprenyl-6-methoxyphenol hydroxylase-like FAD-dependent oxidoreductase